MKGNFQSDKKIHYFAICRVHFYISLSDSIDQDQTARSVQSGLDLHRPQTCLSRTYEPNDSNNGFCFLLFDVERLCKWILVTCTSRQNEMSKY